MEQTPINLRDVTLAILAGGAGSRMGKPKSLLEVRGRPILAYLLDRFAWPGPTMLVTSPGREHPPGADRLNREVTDPVADEGPLRGVLTALEACHTELLIVTTVDMPGIGREQLEWLLEALRDYRPHGAVMLRRGEMIEPFPLALDKDWVDIVTDQLDRGTRSVHSLAGHTLAQVLDAPSDWSPDDWVNLNRPDDYDAWIKKE
jgi:molybdopterin-guanine dinucleotide biosynthesis protein A